MVLIILQQFRMKILVTIEELMTKKGNDFKELLRVYHYTQSKIGKS